MNINNQSRSFNYDEESDKGWTLEKVAYVLFFAFFALGIISKIILF